MKTNKSRFGRFAYGAYWSDWCGGGGGGGGGGEGEGSGLIVVPARPEY